MKNHSGIPAVTSGLEKIALEASGQKLRYEPHERIGVVVVDHFPDLGKLAALRFIEWVLANPGGVIALPTGKTPEHFIRSVNGFLKTWKEKNTLQALEAHGIEPSRKPDLKSLSFVQIDEFYPIDPENHNSFYYYVNRFYIQGFGLDPKKALLINCQQIGLPEHQTLSDVWPDGRVDLSLRFRQPVNAAERSQKSVLEKIDQWCSDYEEKIRALGGIGFFLGGIGPDGHIAFNVTGSDHHSTTRLTHLNYETQASAATDLGGIEVARNRHAITIGLSTLTWNPQCVAIILAAGNGKARMVRDAIMQPAHIRYPATALHKLPSARFYVTQGAASLLTERQYESLSQQASLPDQAVEKILIDVSLESGKPFLELDKKDLAKNRFGDLVLAGGRPELPQDARRIHDLLIQKFEKGCDVLRETRFLHTSPHHDDEMLGYFPSIVRHIRDASNRHTFAYMTSGFNAVTHNYALSLFENLKSSLKTSVFTRLIREGYFDPKNRDARNSDVWRYLDGVSSGDETIKREGESRRLLRNMMEVFEEEDADHLENRIQELIHYLRTQYPGRKDMPHIQKLKGMIREWEADCLWGYLGFNCDSVTHLRLGFYKGDIFTEEPTADRDVPPVLNLLRKTSPDVVTVALDPEASGPDTHYKVLQAIAEALRQYEQESNRSDITIWGYRNVWYRFHPSEADLMVPVSLNMFSLLQSAFMNGFVSQKEASFPSHELDGPFSVLAQKIQVEQYEMLKTCIGSSYFHEHPSPLVRATRGLVFLKKLSLQEFYSIAREIRQKTESGQ
jgi:glucosamine-6-phosphate deaminase